MGKVLLFPVLLVIACLMAGAYGAFHNQISYTVSPDYFHQFKFNQFGIPEPFRNRLGASWVGWQASWWMGCLIAPPILLIGFIIPGTSPYAQYCLQAFAIVAVTTLLVGLGALIYAIITIQNPPFQANERILDSTAFARAGTMHNFSYLGGFLGILTGSAYLIWVWGRLKSPEIGK